MSTRSIQKLRKASQKQEKRTAKEVGGKVQIASGAIVSVGMKGDVRSGSKTSGLNEKDYLVENKLTTTSAYTLNIDTWLKIQKEAMRDSLRIPILQLDIQELQLVILDFATLRERMFTKSVFLAEAKAKKSIVINKKPLRELMSMSRQHGDILVSKLTFKTVVQIRGRSIPKTIELGMIEKFHWEW